MTRIARIGSLPGVLHVLALCALVLSACPPRPPTSDLVINEFVARNQTGLEDEDEDREDWIELYNTTDAAVNLAGWTLSDDPAEPQKWEFPGISLAAGAYLVVFCSDKNRSPVDGQALHTNFRLDGDGEFLGLFRPGGGMASGFPPSFPPQQPDIAYGRTLDGEYSYLDPPTPGMANDSSPSFAAIVSAPEFSVPRGLYAGNTAISVALSSETPGASIRYTFDGSAPETDTGLSYTTPIVVSQSTVLRAAAFKEGWIASPVVTHTYLKGVNRAASSGLPVLTLSGDPGAALYEPDGIMAVVGGQYLDQGVPVQSGGQWTSTGPGDYNHFLERGRAYERAISLEWLDPVVGGQFQVDCGIRIAGSDYSRRFYRRGGEWAQQYHRYAFRLYFRDAYAGEELAYPVFGDEKPKSFERLALRQGMADWQRPFVKDELIRRLHGVMGHEYSRGIFVDLFINGRYQGYYNLVERIDERFLRDKHGGDEDWDIIKIANVKELADLEGEATDGDNVAWQELIQYVKSHDLSVPAYYEEAATRVDVTDFIDYLILNLYMANVDWPQNNVLAARERSEEGIFRFYVWDAEQSMEFAGYNGFLRLNDADNSVSILYATLRASAVFRSDFAQRIRQLCYGNGPLTTENIFRRYREVYDELWDDDPQPGTELEWIEDRRDVFFSQVAEEGMFGCVGEWRGEAALSVAVDLSGMVYHPHSETFYGVSDDGVVYEFDEQGIVLRQIAIPGTNLEGVTVASDTGLLYAVDEFDDRIVEIDEDTLTVLRVFPVERNWDGAVVLAPSGNGLEGIALVSPVSSPARFYLVNQGSAATESAEAPALLAAEISLDAATPSGTAAVLAGYWPVSSTELSDVYYYEAGDVLLAISDEDNTLLQYTRAGLPVATCPIPGANQEAITLTPDGTVRIGQSGGAILRFGFQA